MTHSPTDDKHWQAPWLAIAAERGAPVDLLAPTAGQGHPLPPLYILPPIYPALVFGMVRCIMEAFFMPKFYVGVRNGTLAKQGQLNTYRGICWSHN